MLVYKCDKCKKDIKEKDEIVSAGFGDGWRTKSFCLKCAKPIADFLDKQGFGKDKKQKV